MKVLQIPIPDGKKPMVILFNEEMQKKVLEIVQAARGNDSKPSDMDQARFMNMAIHRFIERLWENRHMANSQGGFAE